MRADENPRFINAGQPFIHRLPPSRVTDSKFKIVPRFGFIILQFAIAIPNHRPLHAGLQVGVIVENVHLFDRVAKDVGWHARAAVVDLGGELDALNPRAGLRRDVAFKQRLNHQRDGGLRRYGGRSGNNWRSRNGKSGNCLSRRVERRKSFCGRESGRDWRFTLENGDSRQFEPKRLSE